MATEESFKKTCIKRGWAYTSSERKSFYNPSDCCSARYNTSPGKLFVYNGKCYETLYMLVFPINVCPYCLLDTTYHSYAQRIGCSDNVYKLERSNHGDIVIVWKFDKCLGCKKLFPIELYVHRKMSRFTYLLKSFKQLL